MQDRVTMDQQGGITIPLRLRAAAGLKGDDQLIIEDTPQGLLIRPLNELIEIYTDERIAEFTRDEQQVADLLDRRKKE